MHDEGLLDLGRVDVHAAGEDEVGAPVGQVRVALVVQVADVAQGGPAIAVARVRGLDRVVVVLERGTVEIDDPVLAGRPLRMPFGLPVVPDD
jgi:hypothetical protein